MKKKQNETTPRGQAIWPKISVPDTKFDQEGVYETQLRLSSEDHAAFLAKVETLLDDYHTQESKRKGKSLNKHKLPFKQSQTQDGEMLDEYDWKFKLKALAGKPGAKWEQRPKIFDSKGQGIKPEEISIGSGSKIRIGYTPHTWFSPALGCGITLQLKAVVIDELISWKGEDFDSFGFDEADDGFVHEAEASADVEGSQDTGSTVEEDSDF